MYRRKIDIRSEMQREKNMLQKKIESTINKEALSFAEKKFSVAFPDINFSPVFEIWRKNGYNRAASLCHNDIRNFLNAQGFEYDKKKFEEVQAQINLFLRCASKHIK